MELDERIVATAVEIANGQALARSGKAPRRTLISSAALEAGNG